jgi:hypothetical protein
MRVRPRALGRSVDRGVNGPGIGPRQEGWKADCGRTGGDATTHMGTSSWCVMLTALSSASSTRPMPSGSGRTCGRVLTLHPGKTRLIEFARHAAANRRARGLGKPETFDFLGFTHISGYSRQGGFQLKRKSRSDRVRAKLRVVKEELRRRMHQTIDEQGRGCGGLWRASMPITLSRSMRRRSGTSASTSPTSGGAR